MSNAGTYSVDTDAILNAINVTVEAKTQAVIKAPQLQLGPGTALGNVVTTTTYPFDYITGFPIVGTTSVQAG